MEKVCIRTRCRDSERGLRPQPTVAATGDPLHLVYTAIDTATNKKVASIPLGGEAGNTQYDPTSHLIYVAVQTKNQLVAIDPQTDKIVARYDLKKGKHPHGFYIDEMANRAYLSCQENNRLIVFNLQSHQEEDAFPVKESPDVLAFDRELKLLYVACESGGVSHWRRHGVAVDLGHAARRRRYRCALASCR